MVRGVPPSSPTRVLCVHPDVEILFQPEARCKQRRFTVLAKLIQIVDSCPNFIRRDVEIVDSFKKVAQKAMGDLLESRAAGVAIKIGRCLQ
jgi:hypothetical protein